MQNMNQSLVEEETNCKIPVINTSSILNKVNPSVAVSKCYIERPRRNYELPDYQFKIYQYIVQAEIDVISSLDKTENTFTEDNIYDKLCDYGFSSSTVKTDYPPNLIKWTLSTYSENHLSKIKSVGENITFEVNEKSKYLSIADEKSSYHYSISENCKRVIIPQQLIGASLVLALPKDKHPLMNITLDNGLQYWITNPSKTVEKLSWSNTHYQYDYLQMQNFLFGKYKNCNYAIIDTNYITVDVDKYEKFRELCPDIDTLMESTFTIKSGRESSDGYHIYLTCSEVPSEFDKQKISVKNKDGEDVGDIRLHAKTYTIGPNSIHPSGNRYTVHTNKEIENFAWVELYGILKPALTVEKKRIMTNNTPKSNSKNWDNTALSKLKFNCLDVLMPDNPVDLGDGKFVGSHPIHGSTTGHNLSVCPDMWYCFRHEAGGGLIQAIVVADGIRECGEHLGPYSKSEWDLINQGIKKRDPEGYKEYRQASFMQYEEKNRQKRLETKSKIEQIFEEIKNGGQK